MRVVLDTNVVVSALIWGGKPWDLVQLAIDGGIELYTSPVLLDELHEVLSRENLRSRLGPEYESVDEAVTRYGALTISVSPTSTPRVVPRDADDDHVVAAAVAGGADLIVSGDRDLLTMGAYGAIRIVTPTEALQLIATL
ncbi:MAG: putative toxin-antitoxin system toxin component, PIN family [Acetobacteraceae bacterium]|nr:putative toxin-antitoxin system toxin component, PIN family [Acetobacteraceae bacterium]